MRGGQRKRQREREFQKVERDVIEKGEREKSVMETER